MKKFPLFVFQARYLVIAVVLLFTEIIIALYVHDQIIRPYIGDVLVVMLLYCLVKSFFNIPVYTLALGVLAFSLLIEIFQYFKLINYLGLRHSRLAHIILGTSFSWIDVLCYVVGILLVIAVEKMLNTSHAVGEDVA